MKTTTVEDLSVGQEVQVMMGGRRMAGTIEYLHPPKGTREYWHVQVDVGGITWLGSPDKVIL